MAESACQNCDWRGPDEDLRPIHDVTARVAPGEPMPSGECPTCGALCHPVPPEPDTKRVQVTTDGTADIFEVWTADVPANLTGDELHDHVNKLLFSGDLSFEREVVSGERDRTVTSIEDLPNGE